jgi:hypothetical protein
MIGSTAYAWAEQIPHLMRRMLLSTAREDNVNESPNDAAALSDHGALPFPGLEATQGVDDVVLGNVALDEVVLDDAVLGDH